MGFDRFETDLFIAQAKLEEKSSLENFAIFDFPDLY